jgi:hypothetical protein
MLMSLDELKLTQVEVNFSHLKVPNLAIGMLTVDKIDQFRNQFQK